MYKLDNLCRTIRWPRQCIGLVSGVSSLYRSRIQGRSGIASMTYAGILYRWLDPIVIRPATRVDQQADPKQVIGSCWAENV